MICLLRLPPRLVIHVYQSPRSVLQEANTLRVVEIWYLGNERVAFKVVLIDMALKQVLLDPVLEALVSKVDAELVKTGHVLSAGEVEKAGEGSKSSLHKCCLMCSFNHAKRSE
jgi:hypothetical protein